jgi:peptidoglycan/LPS O-acetylase OafA/YrhL
MASSGQSEPVRERPRLQELDALRGIAAFCTACYHYIWRYDAKYQVAEKSWLWFDMGRFDEKIVGKLPVFLFFIISGFVISMTLENARHIGDFIVSRFSRLYPTYVFCLLLTFIVGFLFPLPGQELSIIQLFYNFTMVQEYIGQESIDGVYWSLHVELMFYSLMAVLYMTGMFRHVLWFVLAWNLTGLASHLLQTQINWRPPLKLDVLLALEYAHFFSAGVAFYVLWKGRSHLLCYSVLAVSALSFFAALPENIAWLAVLLFVPFGLAIAGKMVFLNRRVLLWMGAVSYAFYLLHQMLGYRVIASLTAVGISRDVAMIAALACTLALANFMTFRIERPAIAAIRKWYRVTLNIA